MTDSLSSNLPKVKQPAPSFVKEGDIPSASISQTQTMVAQTPIISNMPLLDSYIKRRDEAQVRKQPVKLKKASFLNLDNALSILTITFSSICLSKIIYDIVKFIKKRK